MALGRGPGPGPCAGWEGLRNPPAFPPPRQHVAPVSGDSVSRNLEKFNYGQPSWLSPPPPVSEEREARQQGPQHPSPAGREEMAAGDLPSSPAGGGTGDSTGDLGSAQRL